MQAFLHLGYPKCASSFLQRCYLIPENGFQNLLEIPAWRDFTLLQLLTAQDTFLTESFPPTNFEREHYGLMPGLSYEGFLDELGQVDLSLVLKRLHSIFPNAKVLIIIRNQPDLVYSNYLQYVRSGYFRNEDNFLRDLIWDSQQGLWGRLFFDRVYQLTKEIFEEVAILPYEMIHDFPVFTRRLNDFFNTNVDLENTMVRSSPNATSIQIMRLLNFCFRHGLGSPYMTPLPSYAVATSRYRFNSVPGHESSHWVHKQVNRWSLRIGERLPILKNRRKEFKNRHDHLFTQTFGAGNRALSNHLGLRLEKYGYVGLCD